MPAAVGHGGDNQECGVLHLAAHQAHLERRMPGLGGQGP